MHELPGRNARICIVDDSRLDRARATEALAGLGDVESFADAESALAAIGRPPADVVISDLVMPGISGIELLERVRREHPGVDVILVTGDGTLESAIAALRMGASDYLQKPIEPEALRRTVEQTLLRRRLWDENRRLRDTLRTVEACRALAPCLEPGEVYPVALDLVLGALGSSRGLALFRRVSIPQGDGIALRGFEEQQARALRRHLVEGKRVDLSPFERVDVLERGPASDALRAAGIEVEHVLCVPVRARGGETGVIWVPAVGAGFAESELALVRTVQQHAEVALGNAARYSHAKERAFVDDVTEVYNARYLLSAAENEIRRAERYGTTLSVLFLDLDRFKLVNDAHGHLIGSETLRNLSRLLLEQIRQVDTLARYGGDEFTILLPDTAHAAAMSVADRIRRSVEEHWFECGDAPPLRLTVSIGVASFPEHGEARDALLDAADKAMYRAKSLGRNRTCSAAELDRDELRPE